MVYSPIAAPTGGTPREKQQGRDDDDDLTDETSRAVTR